MSSFHLPDLMRRAVLGVLIRWTERRRAPDVVIGESDRPYLLRWHLWPQNRWLNGYYHQFRRSDDDRALHDHPWANCSVLLDGAYLEIVPTDPAQPNGATAHLAREAGAIVLRPRGELAHRVVLYREVRTDDERPVRTLFLTGPRRRAWGFWCPQGWRHWRDFTAPTAGHPSGRVGAGCGDIDGDRA